MLNGAKVTKELLNALDNVKKPQTNADRIRSMSDAELKEFLCTIIQCKFCKFEGWGGCELLEWLQQPTEGE